MPDSLASRMDHLRQSFQERKPVRTGSLIVTMFGDSLAPRGGPVWLGSLIEACALVGIAHRPVRTAVSRLVQDNVLHSQPIGRRSYYQLTANGLREFEEATARIYFQPEYVWQDEWCLVMINLLGQDDRKRLRRRLEWQGFGTLNADTLVHPHPDLVELDQSLSDLSLVDQVLVLHAEPSKLYSGESTPKQRTKAKPPHYEPLLAAWHLDTLSAAYTHFISVFKPILSVVDQEWQGSLEDAFLLRTFLIHEYRKILLRDPALPHQLLPQSWPGLEAFEVSQALYRCVASAAEQYINVHFVSPTGPLPPPDAGFFERFGGLAT